MDNQVAPYHYLDRYVKSIENQLDTLHWLNQSLAISQRIPNYWFDWVKKDNKRKPNIEKPETLLVIGNCAQESFGFAEAILTKSQYDYGMFKKPRFINNEERPNHADGIRFDKNIYNLLPGIHRVEIKLFGDGDTDFSPGGLEALCFYALHPIIFRSVGDILPECELTGVYYGKKRITTKWSEEHHGPHFIVHDNNPTTKTAKPARISIAA